MGIAFLKTSSIPILSTQFPFHLWQNLVFEAKNNRKMLFEPYLATEKLFLLLYVDKVLPKETIPMGIAFLITTSNPFLVHTSPSNFGKIWIFEAQKRLMAHRQWRTRWGLYYPHPYAAL